jgi:hypothetical protein
LLRRLHMACTAGRVTFAGWRTTTGSWVRTVGK